jgi:hypothetical protein
MNSQYITKSDLAQRWSLSLINKYFPICSQEKPNPQYKRGAPMQLYDVGKVRRIESKADFKEDMEKVLKQKIIALERAQKRRMKLIEYANGVQIKIPDFDKQTLIKRACYHYNSWNDWKEYEYFNYTRASPSSDEEFLKRITINYLRHQCTHYDEELQKFYKKVGVREAHQVLQQRINDAIKQKYEWLR